jgi:hypothetical protein
LKACAHNNCIVKLNDISAFGIDHKNTVDVVAILAQPLYYIVVNGSGRDNRKVDKSIVEASQTLDIAAALLLKTSTPKTNVKVIAIE